MNMWKNLNKEKKKEIKNYFKNNMVNNFKNLRVELIAKIIQEFLYKINKILKRMINMTMIIFLDCYVQNNQNLLKQKQ